MRSYRIPGNMVKVIVGMWAGFECAVAVDI